MLVNFILFCQMSELDDLAAQMNAEFEEAEKFELVTEWRFLGAPFIQDILYTTSLWTHIRNIIIVQYFWRFFLYGKSRVIKMCYVFRTSNKQFCCYCTIQDPFKIEWNCVNIEGIFCLLFFILNGSMDLKKKKT